MNKRTNKILSLVLAFVMVLAAVVPAFAQKPGDGVAGPNPKNDKEFSAEVTKGGKLLEKADVYFDGVAYKTNIDGKAKFAPAGGLTGSKTYNVVMGVTEDAAKDAVVEGTPYKFTVTTNSDGKISSVKSVVWKDDKNVEADVKVTEIKFNLKNIAPPAPFFTVFVRKADGSLVKGDKEVKVYKLKLTGNDYLLTPQAVNQVDYNKPLTSADTVDGVKEYKDSSDVPFNWNTTYDRPIVAFVLPGEGVDGKDVVAFANPKLDKVVNLVIPAKDSKFIVNVETCELPTTAIEGAKVELVKNDTVLLGKETWGKTIATATTDKNGRAVFKNVDLMDVLSYLKPQESNLPLDEAAYKALFGKIELPYKIVVTDAKGYKVPAEKVLVVENVLTVNDLDKRATICLKPAGANIVGRISGETRYDTAVELANRIPQADRSNAVILANGNNFADALTGNGLTKLVVKDKQTPILLTNGTDLTPATAKYIKDNEIKNVIILGGTSSVSAALQNKLDSEGREIARLFGADRYETSVAIMERIARYRKDYDGLKALPDVFVANGTNMADALVASVPSAIYGKPILLVDTNKVPASVSAALEKYQVTKATVIGGTSSVSATAAAGLNVSDIERVYGQNRQLTSMVLAKRYFPQAGSAFVASASTPVDALVGGLVAANKQAPILLTDGNKLTKEVGDYIRTHKINDVTVIGGPSTVSESVRVALENVILGK